VNEKPIRSRIQGILVLVVLVYAALLLVAPLIAILGGALEDGVGAVWSAITAPDALLALRLTFTLAILASAINVVLGIITAWVLVRHQFPGKALVNALVDLPFVVSPVVVGFVIIVLFGRQGWLKDLPVQIAFSWPGMLLVTVFVSLPFVVREVMPILVSLTVEQEEAAYTLGASQWLVFRRIIFPAIRHGIIYGLVLTFARSLGEFGAAAVAGGGVQGVTETATIYIFRSIHDRNDVGAYSMAILLGVISVLVLLLMNWLRGRSAVKEVSDVHHPG
jgi:sulfate/thiosulfate transport system permease protein